MKIKDANGNEIEVNPTLDQLKELISSNDEAKKWLQSEKDSVVTKGINTYKTTFLEKDLPKILEDEITKRYPAETPESKRLKELELKFENSEKEMRKAQLKSILIQKATDKKLPTFLVDYSISEDEEISTTKLDQLGAKYLEQVNREVKNRLESKGRKIGLTGEEQQDIDVSKIPDNDPDFFIKNKDAIDKMLLS